MSSEQRQELLLAQQPEQQQPPKRSREVTVLKWGLVAVVLGLCTWTAVVSAPIFQKLLKNAALAAKVYGWTWLIFSLLGCIIPGLAFVVKKAFYRDVSSERAIENLDSVSANLNTEGKSLTPKQLEKLRQNLDRANEEDKPIDDTRAAEIANEVETTTDI